MIADEVRLLLGEKTSEDPPAYRFSHFGHMLVRELLQAYDGLKGEVDSLKLQLKAAERRADEEMCRADCLARDVESLRLVESRVKNGNLTEEEFQAVFRDLSPEDEERYMKGCQEVWQRLSRRVQARQVAQLLGVSPEDVTGG